MIIDFDSITPLNRYHLLTQTVMPRPIAWVLSENEDMSLNLAPFSFFNAMCSEPPLLVMSVGKKPGGDVKDTRRNLLSGRPFVVHIASVDQVEVLNGTAAVLDYGESEVAASSLPLSEFPGCVLPRLSDCHIAYHCKLYDVHEIGPNKQAMIYAEVLQLYLNDTVVEHENNRYIIDPEKVNPLSRLGGVQYSEQGKIFSLTRPK
ncbi:MAG: flavin reductase family protein [Cellvibrionaceae bacterium]